MSKNTMGYPDFKKPPVIEVVCGIAFKPLHDLLAPHIGLLWEKFKTDYPLCQEVSPLAPVIEFYEDTPRKSALDLELMEVPPLPRIWFKHKNDTGIIQIQRDRFLHNWRKIRQEDEYPRYPKVIDMFNTRFSQFKSFLTENELGEIEPIQYEMTYVNHVPHGDGWDSLKEIGKVFPDFSLRDNDARFLPIPETINWQTIYALPDKLGRLHISIRNGKHRETRLPMLYLNLTVRGMAKDTSLEGMQTWFDIAREWIVKGFVDLTGEEIQKKVWGKE